MKNTTRALLASVLTLAGLAAAPAPALAEKVSYADAADLRGASLNDIRKVTLDHGVDATKVRVKVTDLRRRSDAGPAGLLIRIDTRSDRSGPEFQLVTGLYAGTDYHLVKMRRGKPVGDPLSCSHQVKLRYAADVAFFRAANDCLGSPDTLRIGVRMDDHYDGSHPVTDWLDDPRSWTSWVAAG